MKNKCLMFFIILMMIFQGVCHAEESGNFFTIKIHFEEGKNLFETDYQKYSSILLRYKDDKSPIPLSAYCDGYMYGKIPSENSNREVEVFFSEKKNFNDDNGNYEFSVMSDLSAKGIISGDEKGNANPYENITRAEATAMIMRLMGVDSHNDTYSVFEDVPENEWYAHTVTKAKELGVVKGDSQTKFSPDRNVSREEITTMVARALWLTGFKNENKNVTKEDISFRNFADTENISDWALSAYETLGYYQISDIQESGELDKEGYPVSTTILSPSLSATRFEVSKIILMACENFQIYPNQTAISFGFDREMPIIDGSTSTYPFTEAIYRNLFSNGMNHKDKPEAHSKSHASYQRLINNEIDMIIASVYPSEDILSLAQKKNVGLELIPIAYDAMIFFTNINNSANGLTSEQISNIYVDNKYKNWNEIGGPDALLYPYARNYDSGSHAQMQRHFLNGKDINEMIRKETTSVTMSNILTDVMQTETDDPKGYGLGYSIYYYFNNMDAFYNTKETLKLLSINGIYPNDKTIADGSYPLSSNTYIVLREDEPKDSPARRMAEFMLTELGQKCVEEAGFGPLKK